MGVGATLLDRGARSQLADWLALAVALSLPWSTSATAILVVLWLLAALSALELVAIRRELATAAGGLPVLLWLIAAVGMLWAGVSWAERFGGLGGYHRLLVVPLLLAQFRRSDRGALVLYGFLASAICLLIASWALALIPGLATHGKAYGVPVKDYLFQGEIFLICAFALVEAACGFWRERRWRLVVAAGCLVVVFLANIGFIATSRTVLMVAPVLVVLLGYRQFGVKGVLTALLAAAVLSGGLWFASAHLRDRTDETIAELRAYFGTNAVNSTGLHIEFLRRSLHVVAEAPVIGHGTGSIAEEFRRASAGETGAAAAPSVNPHNQILAVAMQLGLLGAIVLSAMWIAHFALFRGGGWIGWVGAVVVVENVVSSVANSHLFDFSQGWLYVFAVGVAGGTVLRERSPHPQGAGTS